MKTVPLLVLDLDGTVRHNAHTPDGFIHGPEDVTIYPAAYERMREWRNAGGRIIAVTSQGGIALGYTTLERVAEGLRVTQERCDGMFSRIMVCQHHPQAETPEMARCWCQKPSPALIALAATEMSRTLGEIYPPHLGLFVGDRPEDEQCARNASMDFMWAIPWRMGGEVWEARLARVRAVVDAQHD